MTRLPRRTPEQILKHYEIEKELANRLRNATQTERRGLYSIVYDELYQRVADHPTARRSDDPQSLASFLLVQKQILRRFITPGITFLEIGPGDCSFSFEMAKIVKQVYAIDVSEQVTSVLATRRPNNFELFITDGISIPVPSGTVDVAFSYNQIEHLHPEDALEQLQNVHDALRSGGVYVCVTPYRSSGPHDISMYFDSTASGFHLKEYSIEELANALIASGFSKIRVLLSYYSWVIPGLFPVTPFMAMERLLGALPVRVMRMASRSLLSVKLVAIK